MKNIIQISLLFHILIHPMEAQERLVPVPPKGDPALVAQSKRLLDAEFEGKANITITSVERFDDKAWESVFPNSEPAVVYAVVGHPGSDHAAGISFIVSASKTKYVVVRSMEPSSFLKALKSNNKRVNDANDAESVARAFVALCGLTISDRIETKQSDEGFTMSLPAQSGRGEAKKTMRIDLELMVDRESRLVTQVKAKPGVVAQPGK